MDAGGRATQYAKAVYVIPNTHTNNLRALRVSVISVFFPPPPSKPHPLRLVNFFRRLRFSSWRLVSLFLRPA